MVLWVADVATELLRRGHRPIVYSPHHGVIAQELRERTIPRAKDAAGHHVAAGSDSRPEPFRNDARHAGVFAYASRLYLSRVVELEECSAPFSTDSAVPPG